MVFRILLKMHGFGSAGIPLSSAEGICIFSGCCGDFFKSLHQVNFQPVVGFL